MRTNKERRQKIADSHRLVFEHLYKILQPGQKIRYDAFRLGDDLGITRNIADDRAVVFQELDLLTRYVHHGKVNIDDGKFYVGRWAEWELLKPYAEAKATLEAWLARYVEGEVTLPDVTTRGNTRGGKPKSALAKSKEVAPVKVTTYKPKMRPSADTAAEDADILADMGIKPKASRYVETPAAFVRRTTEAQGVPEKVTDPATLAKVATLIKDEVTHIKDERVAIATKPDEEVRAIAGPDRPSPFATLAPLRKDEPGALVEAARQYASRSGRIHDQIDKLMATAKELGITLNPDMLAGGVQLETDERLESISLVLPYIDKLEARVVRLTAELTEMRGKGDLETLRNENRRLKTRVEQLVSQRVQAAQRAQAQA